MSHSNGVIAAPVSMSDIQQVLSVSSSTSLTSLCRSTIVKMTSKYKPTDFSELRYTLNIDNRDLAWRGAPKNALYIGCGFSMPCIVLSPSTTVTTTNQTMTLQAYLEGSSIYPYALFDYSAVSMIAPSSKATVSLCSQADFYRYTHNSPHYNYSGSKPFTVSCSLPQAEGRNVIDAGAIITYDYDSIEDGIGAHLGVKDFFTMESDSRMGQYSGMTMTIGSYTGLKFFGVMVWCPRTSKCVISRIALSVINKENDPVSGNPFMRAVFFPTSSLVDDTGTKGFKYGDNVYVIPFILAKNTTPNYVFFGMNQFGTTYLAKTLLGSSAAPSYTNMRITKITGTLTYSYVSAREFDFYFNTSGNVTISCAGYLSGAANRIYYTLDTLYIIPGDSTGYVQSVVSATLGNGYDENSGYRYSTFTSNTGNGSHLVSGGLGFNYMRTRIRFSGSSTSAKVSVSIPVYQNNGGTKMEQKYFTLTFTIDPRSTSTGTVTAEAT